MKRTSCLWGLAAASLLFGCEGKVAGDAGATATAPAASGGAPAGGGGLVRVKVPEAKCEVAIPANMVVEDAKSSGFTIVERGKKAALDGMLIVVMPVGPVGGLTPPGATDVKTLKDEKAADGAVAREGSFNNGTQVLHFAEYVYPVGGEWLHCKIQAAKPEDRDEIAALCRGLAPKAL